MKTTSPRPPLAIRHRRLPALFSIIGLLFAASGIRAADPTLAEMLELGIYTEDTKGDLEGAIKLYAQIVAEAAADRALAAQAQFRLAMCEHKQGDYAAATAAFEKLVSEFSEQRELTSLAREYLSAGAMLLPVPWTHGEEMQYAVRLPAGPRMGLGRWAVYADEHLGRKIWRFVSQVRGGAQQWSQVEVDAETFKPIHCRWKVSLIGEADTVYSAGGADVRMNGKGDARHVEFDGRVYDNEQAVQLIRRLPLADGYETTLHVFTGITGGNVLPVPLKVSGTESVTVPAGTFDCFKVKLQVMMTEQTFWCTTDEHRQVVKLEANGAVIELTRIVNVAAAQPVTYQDDTFDFSLTLPAGWMVDRMNPADDERRSVLMLLDPRGEAAVQVSVHDRSRYDAADVASPRRWAEHQIEQRKRHANRFELDADSWQDLTIDGQPAVSFEAAIVDAPSPATQRMCAFHTLIDDMAVEFWFITMPEAFADFRQKFGPVLTGFHSH